MKVFRILRRRQDPVPPPGDDVVPVPPPITEEPPLDRYCDLVLTGGVASGVVYPWAIVELARAYRFRNIGGTSVGAMAAALAAAAEYGRRTGYENPFEPLRRAPASLGFTYADGRTRMLSLFQTNRHGRRLIHLWGKVFNGDDRPIDDLERRCPRRGTMMRALWLTLRAYWVPLLIGAGIGVDLAFLLLSCMSGLLLEHWPTWAITAFFALVIAFVGLLVAFWHDIRYGLIENSYGLCKGGNLDGEDGPPGISQWLHDGIQASAGLKEDDPPLTFRDLWTAPDYPGAESRPCGRDDPPGKRSINLQMLTTNVTHGRPYRLPMVDRTSRLFFRPDELKDYFPPCVLDALVKGAQPYTPLGKTGRDPVPGERTTLGAFELPAEDLPIVVAARLSLSFPLLFSAVPLWAIDYEAPFGARTLRRCMFTDGGASSNFPIHLFDAAVPTWPTFGLWLDKRGPYQHFEEEKRQNNGTGNVDANHNSKADTQKLVKKDGKASDQLPEQEVWLPEFNGQGFGDNWNRFDAESTAVEANRVVAAPDSRNELRTMAPISCPEEGSYNRLFGFLSGVATSATDWRDRTNLRMPHIRNRVARPLLFPGEGGLHIGMPKKQILEMAHRYGTKTGRAFADRYVDNDGEPSRAWKEQRWVRFNLLVNSLREMLAGMSASAAWSTRTLPLDRAIDAATREGPVRDSGRCQVIELPADAEALKRLLHELEGLERELQLTPKVFDGGQDTDLRLSARL